MPSFRRFSLPVTSGRRDNMSPMRMTRWLAACLLVVLATVGLEGCGVPAKEADGTPRAEGAVATPIRGIPLPQLDGPNPTLTATSHVASSSSLTPSPVAPGVPGVSAAVPNGSGVAPKVMPAPVLHPSAELAARAAADGDYDHAIALWRAVIDGAEGALLEEASLALGRVYVETGRYHEAIAWLVPYVEAVGDKPVQAQALGLLGVSYEALGEWRPAIAAYEQYLATSGQSLPHVHLHLADAHLALEEPEQALAQMTQIDLASLDPSRRAEALQEKADIERSLGEYDAALTSYEAILGFSQYASYRALVGYRMAETLAEAGRADEAIRRHSAVIIGYPESYAARLALDALDEMGASDSVDDLARGEVLYHAGRYADALEVLDRYLLNNADGDIAHASYLGGRAAHALAIYPRAFRDYDVVMTEYPGAPDYADAWLHKARASGENGGDSIGLYREFWRQHPDSPRAPDALLAAGETLEAAGEWSRAAEYFGLLHTHYPEHEEAADAAFRQGFCLYRAGDDGGALVTWRTHLDETTVGKDRARLLVWLGLVSVVRDEPDAAQIYWQHGMLADPEGYYGLRAADLRVGGQEIMPLDPPPYVPSDGVSQDEWATIEAWVVSWHGSGASSIDVVAHPLAQQALALQQLTWHQATVDTLRALRTEVWNDPAGLLALARLCDSRGVPSLAITCATRLMRLARETSADGPPRPLLEMAYPTPYLHLIEAEAETYGVDPLLFLALMRQESRFDPRAVSYAGATGLTQVMPDTGEWIALRLGDEDYVKEDLRRPVISIHYGMWFMGQLLDMNRRDWIAALVAYNAGPGNLRKWTNDQPIAQHDLFYETLPVQQAQDYVWLIYEQYRMYQQLYSRR